MIQKPKGTNDIINDQRIVYILDVISQVMDKYNYQYFRTPIFESSDLFHRGVGDTSDIVTKETYDFKDRSERNLTLRPEGTAGIVRSYIENKLYGNTTTLKTWYYGPMFRYERPQKGRFREFYQFGVEVFGSHDAILDAEVISIPVTIYKLLGLKGIKVNINTLGDNESREKYREALINYFKPHVKDLCEDCQNRFLKNPLRILDCKVDAYNEIMKNAPKTIDYLSEESKKHFEDLKKHLEALNIDYVVNTSVVRGLDYYTNTVFEVEADIEEFGANNVLCGGGRYDNLVETLNGPKTPAVGFAMGFERLLNALDAENINLIHNNHVDTYIAYMSEEEKSLALRLCHELRLNGFKAEIDYNNRNLKSNFKNAENLNSKFIIIIGEDEVKNNYVTIKNLNTKEEDKIDINYLVYYLDEKLSSECNCGHCEEELHECNCGHCDCEGEE